MKESPFNAVASYRLKTVPMATEIRPNKRRNKSILAKSLIVSACLFFSLNLTAADCFFGNLADQVIGESAESDKNNYTKTIKKEFPLQENGTTDLRNKYGKIELQTWEKNRVKVEVNIVVKTKSEREAQEVFDRILIQWNAEEDLVKVATHIESKKSSWWGWDDNNTEFQINYLVFMPKTGNLALSNKYGDASVAEINGAAKINVQYGNFSLAGLGGDLDLDLGYGSGLIQNAADIEGKVAYSKLRIVRAKDINLETQYSKMTVERASDVDIASRYDNYEVGIARDFKCEAQFGDMLITSVENVQCNSHYTEYHIDKVGQNADFNLEYGGVVVDQVARGFSEIILVGQYANYQLTVHSDADFSLDADGEFAGIRYPQNLKVDYEVEKAGRHSVKGRHGSGNSGSVIKANLNYGGLKVVND